MSGTMKVPRVSVLIPTYNRAALVCEAIESVLRQNWRDFEIIVIDDGSTDDTPTMLRRYGDAIRYVRQSHDGVHSARNHAMRLARGEFLAPLDSDDLWEPWKLGLMVQLLERFSNVGFAFSNFSHLRRDGSVESDGLRSWHSRQHLWEEVFDSSASYASLGLAPVEGLPRDDFTVHTGDIFLPSMHEHWVNPCSTLIRVASLASGECFPEIDDWSGEIDFFARLSHRTGSLFVDIESVLNRSHDDGIRLSHADSAKQLASRTAVIDRVWRTDAAFMREHRELADRAQFPMLIRLAGLLIVRGERDAAHRALMRADALHVKGRRALRGALRLAALTPGSRYPVQALRRIRQAIITGHF